GSSVSLVIVSYQHFIDFAALGSYGIDCAGCPYDINVIVRIKVTDEISSRIRQHPVHSAVREIIALFFELDLVSTTKTASGVADEITGHINRVIRWIEIHKVTGLSAGNGIFEIPI